MKSRRERLLAVLLAVLCIYAITLKDSISEAITNLFSDEGMTVASATATLTVTHQPKDILIFVNGGFGEGATNDHPTGTFKLKVGDKVKIRGVLQNDTVEFVEWDTDGCKVSSKTSLAPTLTITSESASISAKIKNGSNGNSKEPVTGGLPGSDTSEDIDSVHQIDLKYDSDQGSVKLEKIVSYGPAGLDGFMSDDVVGITITPNDGYDLDELHVKGTSEVEYEETTKGNNGQYSYSFVMPNADVNVEVTFKEKVKECEHVLQYDSNNGFFSDEKEHWVLCKKCDKELKYEDETWSTGKKLIIGKSKHTLDSSTGQCQYCKKQMMEIATSYTIKVSTNTSYALVSVLPSTAKAGDKVTLNTQLKNTRSSYEFSNWEVIKGDVAISSPKKDGNKYTSTFTMPNEEVEIKAIYKDGNIKEKEEGHDVIVTTNNKTYGSVTASAIKANAGESVTITAYTNDAHLYTFSGWKVVKGGITLSQSSTTTFTMPDREVEIIAVLLPIEDTKEIYEVDLYEKVTGGAAKCSDKLSGKTGDKITIEAIPDKGYELNKWIVNGTNTSTKQGNKITITLEKGDVLVYPVFKARETPSPSTPPTTKTQITVTKYIFDSEEYKIDSTSTSATGDVVSTSFLHKIDYEGYKEYTFTGFEVKNLKTGKVLAEDQYRIIGPNAQTPRHVWINYTAEDFNISIKPLYGMIPECIKTGQHYTSSDFQHNIDEHWKICAFCGIKYGTTGHRWIEKKSYKVVCGDCGQEQKAYTLIEKSFNAVDNAYAENPFEVCVGATVSLGVNLELGDFKFDKWVIEDGDGKSVTPEGLSTITEKKKSIVKFQMPAYNITVCSKYTDPQDRCVNGNHQPGRSSQVSSYGSNDTRHWIKCTVCGEELASEHNGGHDWKTNIGGKKVCKVCDREAKKYTLRKDILNKKGIYEQYDLEVYFGEPISIETPLAQGNMVFKEWGVLKLDNTPVDFAYTPIKDSENSIIKFDMPAYGVDIHPIYVDKPQSCVNGNHPSFNNGRCTVCNQEVTHKLTRYKFYMSVLPAEEKHPGDDVYQDALLTEGKYKFVGWSVTDGSGKELSKEQWTTQELQSGTALAVNRLHLVMPNHEAIIQPIYRTPEQNCAAGIHERTEKLASYDEKYHVKKCKNCDYQFLETLKTHDFDDNFNCIATGCNYKKQFTAYFNGQEEHASSGTLVTTFKTPTNSLGRIFRNWEVKDANQNSIQHTSFRDGGRGYSWEKLSFVMPPCDVFVTAIYEDVHKCEPKTDGEFNGWSADPKTHYKECSGEYCSNRIGEAEHTPEYGTCTICGRRDGKKYTVEINKKYEPSGVQYDATESYTYEAGEIVNLPMVGFDTIELIGSNGKTIKTEFKQWSYDLDSEDVYSAPESRKITFKMPDHDVKLTEIYTIYTE